MLTHNQYFDGKVQSIGFSRNGLKATVGVMAAGTYTFNTGAAERMTVISGTLRARLGGDGWATFPMGSAFEVAANGSFEVEAVGGPAAYLCEFLG